MFIFEYKKYIVINEIPIIVVIEAPVNTSLVPSNLADILCHQNNKQKKIHHYRLKMIKLLYQE